MVGAQLDQGRWAARQARQLLESAAVKLLPLREEGRLPDLEDNFWYDHVLLDVGSIDYRG